jgi:hypothetical protein
VTWDFMLERGVYQDLEVVRDRRLGHAERFDDRWFGPMDDALGRG